MAVSKCGLCHDYSRNPASAELLWHVCPSCYSIGYDTSRSRLDVVLQDLPTFKRQMTECVGQDARILIKRALQKTDEEWLVTILRKMKSKKLFNGIVNSWNALQSAFTEPPFDVFAMNRAQVAMLCYTIKAHLRMHVEVYSKKSKGSLWDFIPEPRLPVSASSGSNDDQADASMEMTCEEEEQESMNLG